MDSDRHCRISAAVGNVPDRIPLEWTEPLSLDLALQDALRCTQECAAVCLDIVPALPKGVRGPVATVFGAASFAAELLEEEDFKRPAALALCIRIIDSNLHALDEAGSSPGCVGPGAAARRCADRCRRALAALYLSDDELL